jgi:hypothetical protein
MTLACEAILEKLKWTDLTVAISPDLLILPEDITHWHNPPSSATLRYETKILC